VKLSRIVEQIVNAVPDQALSVHELYASLDFRGPRNAHLAISDWHTPEFRTPDMARHEFLTGEEEISGEVLVFCYNSHDCAMTLHDCATLNEASEMVVDDAGVFNVFTDLLLVFDHFTLRPYRVTYRDHKGARVVWDGSHKKDDRPFPDRRIEWSELVAQNASANAG